MKRSVVTGTFLWPLF